MLYKIYKNVIRICLKSSTNHQKAGPGSWPLGPPLQLAQGRVCDPSVVDPIDTTHISGHSLLRCGMREGQFVFVDVPRTAGIAQAKFVLEVQRWNDSLAKAC